VLSSRRPSLEPEDLEVVHVLPVWLVACVLVVLALARWRSVKAGDLGRQRLHWRAGDVVFLIATTLVFVGAVVFTARVIWNEFIS
jgi:uncharacterized membrane protein YidH (DUF202 family)